MGSDSEEPPYRRIAAEIRRRIASGRLKPGDRVPSTRQIARDWGVALATATKVLTSLRQDGLVESVPRVGTVVAPDKEGPVVERAGEGAVQGAAAVAATPPQRGREGELSRDRVVRAAIEIADAEGLDTLSMRGVAARLGVATMSTYRHVTSKDELVLLMADAAFGELGYPDDPPAGWRPLLERGARTMWALHRRHPWLAQLSPLTRPLPLPNLQVHGEQLLSALERLDFDPVTRLDLQVVIYSYVQGLAVNLEREVRAQDATGLSGDEWMELQGPALSSIAATGRYPAFARLLAALGDDGYDLDLDRLFELGLRIMLDGLAGLADESGEADLTGFARRQGRRPLPGGP